MFEVVAKVPSSKSLISEGYVTFHEACKLVKPLIGNAKFIEFLQEEGYLNEYGLPAQSKVENDTFHVWHYTKPNEEYASYILDVFITPFGLKEITDRAINKYLNFPKVFEF